jgi:Fur family transcriptional regulator, ferric uptake regulator
MVRCKNNFPMTAQRRIILAELRRVTTHPTADEVFAIVRKSLPRISLGTVYRNLEKMSEEGIIQKIEIAGRRKRFDATIESHYHVRCTECGKVDDLHGLRFMDLESVSRKLCGYLIEGCRLELTGMCPQCLKASKKRTKKVN